MFWKHKNSEITDSTNYWLPHKQIYHINKGNPKAHTFWTHQKSGHELIRISWKILTPLRKQTIYNPAKLPKHPVIPTKEIILKWRSGQFVCVIFSLKAFCLQIIVNRWTVLSTDKRNCKVETWYDQLGNEGIA